MTCPDADIKYHWTPTALYELKTQVLLRKWKTSCLWTSYSSPFACSDCAVSAGVLLHPHPLLRCPGNVPRPQQPHSACRRGHQGACSWRCAGQEAGLWHVGDHSLLPVHLNSHLGPAFNFWPPPPSKQNTVFSFRVYTCGKILNKIHLFIGSFSRSCFRVALHFLGRSQGILCLLKMSWAKW